MNLKKMSNDQLDKYLDGLFRQERTTHIRELWNQCGGNDKEIKLEFEQFCNLLNPII